MNDTRECAEKWSYCRCFEDGSANEYFLKDQLWSAREREGSKMNITFFLIKWVELPPTEMGKAEKIWDVTEFHLTLKVKRHERCSNGNVEQGVSDMTLGVKRGVI